MDLVNLRRIERWPNDKVMDFRSDKIKATKQQRMKKTKPNSKVKRKQDQKQNLGAVWMTGTVICIFKNLEMQHVHHWPSNITSAPTVNLGQNCVLTVTPEIGHEWFTWYANSRVWQRTSAATCPAKGSICWRVERTNTAVFPIPDLAWQMTSIPRIACGMHSCCTAPSPNDWIAFVR